MGKRLGANSTDRSLEFIVFGHYLFSQYDMDCTCSANLHAQRKGIMGCFEEIFNLFI